MFFNAHTYHSIHRSGTAKPMRVLGAILADSALTGVVGWADLHDMKIINKLGARAGQSDAAVQMIEGLRDHYDLDIRSHESYDNGAGYAFSHQTPQLVEIVAQACGLADREKAKGIAHNFIESGVDWHLLKVHPEIQAQGHQALKAADTRFAADLLSRFYDKDGDDTATRLAEYIDLATRYDLRAVDEWVLLWADIISLLMSYEADKAAVKKGLLLAIDLTGSDYMRVVTD